MADVQTFEVDVERASIDVGPWILYSHRSSEDEQLLMRPFLRGENEKFEHGGQLKFTINIL
jgi:hypothetical protein